MGYGAKYDEKPLFAPGRHYISLQAIQEICVSPFSQSVTRKNLFLKLEKLIQEILRKHIRCDLMIDGSFLTQKIDPEDIDVAAHISSEFAESMTEEQGEFLQALTLPEYVDGLDTFVEVEYPRDHAEYPNWKAERSWGEQWGVEHSKRWLKGVVVLRLWETNVGLRIRR